MVFSSSLFAQNAALTSFIGDKRLEGASIGVCVVELKTGKEIITSDPNLSLSPASSIKAMVTHAALEILGPEHRFVTRLYMSGKLDKGGVLDGDLVIVGFGDPTLGSTNFGQERDAFINEWLLAIKQKGIRSVTGSIIVDDAYFDGSPIEGSTPLEDAGNYYGASVHSINVFDNACSISLSSGPNTGDPVKVQHVFPDLPGVTFICEALAADDRKDNAFVFGQPFDHERFIRGTIPKASKNFQIKGSIPDPAMVVGNELLKGLQAKNILVAGPVKVERGNVSYPNQTLIHEHLSEPLSKIVYFTNRKSINLYAAALLCHLGMEHSNVGSFESGVAALKAFYEKLSHPTTGFWPVDGSGLSRANAVTARQLAMSCNFISESSEKAFVESLSPFAGRSSLLVKSGYITRVRSYCGRSTLPDGRKVAFAVIVNNFSCTPTEAKNAIIPFLEAISTK